MYNYSFEGKSIATDIPQEVLDRLASFVITYRMLKVSGGSKATNIQLSFIKGFIHGLLIGGTITDEDKDKLVEFFSVI
jgi:hypothetical protein